MAYAQPNDLLTKQGPEDKYEFQSSPHAYSWRYGPLPSAVPGPDVTDKDKQEVDTLGKFISTQPYQGVIESLAHNRHICMRQYWVYHACAKRYTDHTAPQYCAGALFEIAKCKMKLARKVQHECKQEVKDLARCYRKEGQGNRSKCFDQYLAFDVCTEDF